MLQCAPPPLPPWAWSWFAPPPPPVDLWCVWIGGEWWLMELVFASSVVLHGICKESDYVRE